MRQPNFSLGDQPHPARHLHTCTPAHLCSCSCSCSVTPLHIPARTRSALTIVLTPTAPRLDKHTLAVGGGRCTGPNMAMAYGVGTPPLPSLMLVEQPCTCVQRALTWEPSPRDPSLAEVIATPRPETDTEGLRAAVRLTKARAVGLPFTRALVCEECCRLRVTALLVVQTFSLTRCAPSSEGDPQHPASCFLLLLPALPPAGRTRRTRRTRSLELSSKCCACPSPRAA